MPQRFELITGDPGLGAHGSSMAVTPLCDTLRGRPVADEPGVTSDLDDSVPTHNGSLDPAFKMLLGRQPVAFLVVAGSMREDEIVAQIARVPGPGNEVVDVAGAGNYPSAVEAVSVLDLFQSCTKSAEGAPIGTEQEAREVSIRAKQALVCLLHESQPLGLGKSYYEPVETAQIG